MHYLTHKKRQPADPFLTNVVLNKSSTLCWNKYFLGIAIDELTAIGRQHITPSQETDLVDGSGMVDLIYIYIYIYIYI